MKKRKNIILYFTFLPLAVSLLAFLGIWETLELKTLDWRFRLRGPSPASDKVFIVAVGDESVSSDGLGRWPWRRGYMASFVNWMKPFSPSDVVFDVLFTEPSGDFPEDDILLASQSQAAGSVYFPFYLFKKTGAPEEILEDRFGKLKCSEFLERISVGDSSALENTPIPEADGAVLPIQELAEAAKGSGYVNVEPDTDGVTRRVPLVMRYGDYILPSVALDVVVNYLGASRGDVIIEPGRKISIKTKDGEVDIPVDEKCRMLVNHPGGFSPENIDMASFMGIVSSYDSIRSGSEPLYDLHNLEDRIVFLGLTATGTSDLRPTPYSPIFPMVGFLASAVSNMLEGDYLIPVGNIPGLLIIFLAGVFALFTTSKLKALYSAGANILFLSAYFFAAFLLFRNNYVLPVFYPLASVLISYTGLTLYRFMGEEGEKKEIKGVFQRYVSSQIVDELLKDPDKVRLGGERKHLTVLFSDIRGFTSMSEKLAPENVVHILNEYLTEMIDVVFKYGGTLDKFMGDAVMAVWGAPLKQQNHAELAVKAAVEMRRRLKKMQEKWLQEGKNVIDIGIGINTGDVIVGNMGSDQFADYTVIGDDVNLAARLEESARAGQILISESTFREAGAGFEISKMPPLNVKGKEKPVVIYEVKDSGEDPVC